MGVRRRLGVGRALVQGSWVAGDVWVDADGRVDAVGSSPAGRPSLSAVPGFVDLQCNGLAGVDFVRATPGSVAHAAAAASAHGVVAIAPTLYSCTADEYVDALGVLDETRRTTSDQRADHAELLGAHLEGPFLSRRWAGAHDPARLIDPDLAILRRLLAAGHVARVTLAPELPGADVLIDVLRAAGIAVSMGHSDASAEQARAAIDLGVESITHCFNAHRRFTSRDPGPAAVALNDPRMTVTAIADGEHLAADTLRLVFAAAPGRVAVVSDAVASAGTGSPAPRRDGVLAGSSALLDDALRYLLRIGIDERSAIAAVATTPGRFAGLGPHDLRVGSAGRAVVCDEEWTVVPVGS